MKFLLHVVLLAGLFAPAGQRAVAAAETPLSDQASLPAPEPSMSAVVGGVLIVIGAVAKRNTARRRDSRRVRRNRIRLTWTVR